MSWYYKNKLSKNIHPRSITNLKIHEMKYFFSFRYWHWIIMTLKCLRGKIRSQTDWKFQNFFERIATWIKCDQRSNGFLDYFIVAVGCNRSEIYLLLLSVFITRNFHPINNTLYLHCVWKSTNLSHRKTEEEHSTLWFI